jgi:hypothetical protein
MALISKVEERRQPLRSREDDIAAVAAVAAVWPASRNEHLASEAAASIAAATGFHGNRHFVDKQVNPLPWTRRPLNVEYTGYTAASQRRMPAKDS